MCNEQWMRRELFFFIQHTMSTACMFAQSHVTVLSFFRLFMLSSIKFIPSGKWFRLSKIVFNLRCYRPSTWRCLQHNSEHACFVCYLPSHSISTRKLTWNENDNGQRQFLGHISITFHMFLVSSNNFCTWNTTHTMIHEILFTVTMMTAMINASVCASESILFQMKNHKTPTTDE